MTDERATTGRSERLRQARQELGLLRRLSRAVLQAERLDDVYALALDVVRDCCGADRAALLLFDPDGVMRFKAWQGLSAEYRAAVEGHTPWSAEETGATPLVVPDVTIDAELAAYGELFAREGLAALTFVPLAGSQRLLGKFMIYFDRPHRPDPEVLQLVETVAAQIAFAVERAGVEEQLAAEGRRKDEFLAVLGHELRNPLAAIKSALDLLELADDGRRHLWAREVAARNVRQLTALLDDLLDLTRISRGKIELRRRDVDLDQVVAGALQGARRLFEDRRLELAVDVEPITLWGDPARLEQVVVNLLSNAVKYTPPGGRVDVVGGRRDGEAVLVVRDTGVGIPSGRLEQIFEPFAQVEPGRKGGLGIGLTLVKQLVTLHGGSVTVSSEGEGRGSAFEVHLPIRDGAAAPRPEPQRAATSLPPGARVLLVEDHPELAEALATLLRERGLEVAVAGDGAAALAMAPQLHPQAALVDIGLPDVDGYEVGRRLRRAAPDLCLVALSGFGHAEARRDAFAAGFDHHVAKPAELDHLVALLADCVRPRGPVG